MSEWHEWKELIQQAKNQGFSTQELREWFESVKIRAINTDQ